MPFGRAFCRRLLPADSSNDPICHVRERRFHSTARVGSRHHRCGGCGRDERDERDGAMGAMGAMSAMDAVAGVTGYG
jgi:hypothetical protein